MLPMPVSATTTKFRCLPSDTLAAILQSIPGVFGARLTGGGFGGACVALVESGKAGVIASEAIDRYQRAGYSGRVLVPEIKVNS